jgi:hypothetical protein
MEKTNGNRALAQPSNGDGGSTMPEEFAGLYQAGYGAGYASGHEAGYQRGLEAGRLEGQAAVHQNENGGNSAAAPPESNAVGIPKARLFSLPCAKCRRFMYTDEARCLYCKTPRVPVAEPPSATRF